MSRRFERILSFDFFDQTSTDSARPTRDATSATARYSLIQLGLTLVSHERNGREEILSFSSYNLFAFPYVRHPRSFLKVKMLVDEKSTWIIRPL